MKNLGPNTISLKTLPNNAVNKVQPGQEVPPSELLKNYMQDKEDLRVQVKQASLDDPK